MADQLQFKGGPGRRSVADSEGLTKPHWVEGPDSEAIDLDNRPDPTIPCEEGAGVVKHFVGKTISSYPGEDGTGYASSRAVIRRVQAIGITGHAKKHFQTGLLRQM